MTEKKKAKESFIHLFHQLSDDEQEEVLITLLSEEKNFKSYQNQLNDKRRNDGVYDQSWQAIVVKAAEVTGASNICVFLIDVETEQVIQLATSELKSQYLQNNIHFRDISIEIVQTGNVKLIEDVQGEDRLFISFLEESNILAATGFPLASNDARIGVVWFFYNEPRVFSSLETAALQLYVNQLGVIYEYTQRLRELEHVRQTVESLTDVVGLPQVLNQIAISACEVLRANSAVIWAYDETRYEFDITNSVAYGISKDLWMDFKRQHPGQTGTADMVIQRGWVGVHDISDVAKYSFITETTRTLLHQAGVKSYQGIALTVESEILGILYVNYNREHIFSNEEQNIARTFANHATLALRNAQTLQRVHKAREATALIAKVMTLADLNNTLVSIVNGVQNVLDCDAVTLYAYDERKQRLEAPPVWGGVRYPGKTTSVEEPGSLVYQLLSQDTLIYIAEDVSSDPIFMNSRFSQKEGIESCAAVRLQIGSTIVGVLFINYRSRHHFAYDELENIQLFANQTAIAIHNAQLFERVQQRASALEALNKAGEAVTATLNSKEILNLIVKQAHLLMSLPDRQVGYSSIWLVDEGKEKAVLVTAYPMEGFGETQDDEGTAMERQLQSGSRSGITGRAIKTGHSQLVLDVTQDPDYWVSRKETRSELAVPIFAEGNVIGVINVEHPEYNAFDEQDMYTLQAFANQAGIAIAKAQQYEELRTTKGLVGARTALAWMGMASNAWRHDIEGDAVNIRNGVALLRLLIQDAVSDKAQLEKIESRLDLIQRLSQSILERPITPPLSSDEGMQEIYINKLILERMTQLWESGEPYSSVSGPVFNLEVTEDVTVWASSEWIRLALDLLVDNAVDAMASFPQKQIEIITTVVHDYVEIVVKDTGEGIPERILENLFTSPSKAPSREGHLGRGLLMVQAVVQTYGGDVYVKATGSEGTEMAMTFPVASKLRNLEARSSLLPGAEVISPSSQLKPFYDEVVKAYEEARELNKRQTHLLSTVSHELRTPLTYIHSGIENTLAEMYGPITAQQRMRLSIALAGVHHEEWLIDNLLDLVRIQENRVVLDLEKGSLINLIHQVLDIFEYDALQKKISIQNELPENDVLILEIDVGKIKQVITNLISNALKFTPAEGEVFVSARRNEDRVEVWIRDTGNGIPKRDFEKVFERFYQGDSSETRRAGGLGVGLNIVKEYVQMHKGRVWIEESELGRGTLFIFDLPSELSEPGR